MVRPAQTARSERTREALRQAALVRFIAQGVEETSAEQIAADAGVSLRTFYRHFASKHDLLFADYDAGLHWFRSALAARSPDESIIESVQSAIMARPYDDWAVTQDRHAACPGARPGPDRPAHPPGRGRLRRGDRGTPRRDNPPKPGTDERMRITVTARCIAAAVFGAMEVWMLGEDRSLPELARLCRRRAGDAAARASATQPDAKFRHY